MGLNNGKVWIPVASLVLAVGGAYLSSQVSIAQQLGSHATRTELKETVKETREQTQRELDDIKKQQERTYQEIQEINRNLKELIRRDDKRPR